jgi:hypothetical protein
VVLRVLRGSLLRRSLVREVDESPEELITGALVEVAGEYLISLKQQTAVQQLWQLFSCPLSLEAAKDASELDALNALSIALIGLLIRIKEAVASSSDKKGRFDKLISCMFLDCLREYLGASGASVAPRTHSCSLLIAMLSHVPLESMILDGVQLYSCLFIG